MRKKSKLTIALSILDAIEYLELSPDELQKVGQYLTYKTSKILNKTPVEPEKPLLQTTSPQKGYSKNGKKLGRPPKRKNVPEKQVLRKEPPVEEYIESLKYGKEYPYRALYQVRGVLVTTNRLLYDETGVKKLGVIIPYTNQGIKKEIVLYYADEEMISIEQARMTAYRLPLYKNRHWRLREERDDAFIHQGQPILDEILKKMGGSPFQGRYFDGRNNYFDSRKRQKVRYVCDTLV